MKPIIDKILPWSKDNYEKLILGVLSVLLIVTLMSFLKAANQEEKLAEFRTVTQPPRISPVTHQPINAENIQSHMETKPKSYYQPISERAVFFPKEAKPVIVAPDMDLECVNVTSAATGAFVATLRNRKTNATYNAQEGEQVENFTVISVSRELVVLSGEGRQHRLPVPLAVMPFRLTGIMPLNGGFEAMLQSETTKQTHFAEAGKKGIEGWEVLSISENTVIIYKSDVGKYELRIGSEPKRIQE
jgi:hypothetical protein